MNKNDFLEIEEEIWCTKIFILRDWNVIKYTTIYILFRWNGWIL